MLCTLQWLFICVELFLESTIYFMDIIALVYCLLGHRHYSLLIASIDVKFNNSCSYCTILSMVYVPSKEPLLIIVTIITT